MRGTLHLSGSRHFQNIKRNVLSFSSTETWLKLANFEHHIFTSLAAILTSLYFFLVGGVVGRPSQTVSQTVINQTISYIKVLKIDISSVCTGFVPENWAQQTVPGAGLKF